MKQTCKRSLALLMALVLCLSLLPVLHLDADAAEFEYVYDSTGKYIYNWGTRGETATTLSPNAEKFYKDNLTDYADLAAYTGGTGTSDAPNSELYKALQTLMVSKHSYQTSYDATRDLYKYTDCQNSAKDSTSISSFYSGKAIGPAWDSGNTWNREHTWPDSKGLAGNDENDIMMLRPTAKDENGARGNKAYGESAGYYFPNTESGGTYDVRGDVARIFLYVYVRWGNVNGNGSYTTWGSSGVMESLDVLLKWMEEDPVDTWELGRNDSVQSITGTRNVFVDYPELAFLLFGADVPVDMTTPSGEASQKCEHNNFNAGVVTAPTCTAKGYTTYTCQTAGCGYSYKSNMVAATGHNYVDGSCSGCGEAEPAAPVGPEYVTELEAGKAYKLGLYSTGKSATYYFTGVMSGYYGATDTSYNNGIDVYVEETTGGYYMYFVDSSNAKQYVNLVQSGTYYNFTFGTTASSVFTWDAEKDALCTTVGGEVCYIGTYGSYVTMGVLRTSKLKDTDYIARMYVMGGNTPEAPECEHKYDAVVTAPTCTEAGYTTYTCSLCGNTYKGDTVDATGHNYVSGTCTGCGEAEPTANQATITFDDTSKRTEFTASVQVWVENGITVTNNKAASTNDVGNYLKPARFYAGSSLTIEFPGMTKIVFNCNDYKNTYPAAIRDSIGNMSGVTVTVDGTVVTVEFAQAQDSFVIAKMTAQARVDSITVYAADAETPEQPTCQHTNTEIKGAVDATCTTDGYTGDTYCTDCNECIETGKAITSNGHYYENGVCIHCGAEEPGSGETTTSQDTYVIADYDLPTTAGAITDFALDDVLSISLSNGVKNGDLLRVYAHQILTFKSAKPISSIVLKASNKGGTFYVETSTDGVTWTRSHTDLTWTSAESDVEISFEEPAQYIRLIPSAQMRIRSMTITFVEAGEPACEHTNTKLEGAVDATCTTDGYTGDTVCADCGHIVLAGEVIIAGHNYVNYFCSVCGQEDPNAPKYTIYFVVPEGVDAVASMLCGPSGVSLPAAGQIEGYTFLGWVTGAVDNATTAPEYMGEAAFYNASADVVLYALYTYTEETAGSTTSAYVKVTTSEDFTTGTYVMIANNGYGPTVYNNKWLDAAKPTVSGNTVTDPKGCVWTLTVNGASVTLKDSKNQFVKPGSGNTNAIQTGSYNWNWVFSNGTFQFKGTGSDTTTLASNTGSSNKFRAYKNTTVSGNPSGYPSNFTLYKLMETTTPGTSVTYYTTVIGEDACAHISTQIVKGQDATCTAAGYKTMLVCTACEETLTIGLPVAALGHELGQYEGKAATCTENGWEAYESCSRCDYTTYAEILAEGHDLTQHNAQAPTCTEIGWEAYEACSRCAYSTYVEIPANGHSYDIDVTEATCYDAGYTTYNCSVCGHNYVGDHVDALGHDGVATGGYAATCTENGLSDLVTCSRCSEVLAEQEVIPATGHHYEAVVTAPTCTQHGYTTYTCSGCNDSYTCEYVKPRGHKEVVTKGKKPTCTEDGYTESSYCRICNEVLSVRAIILATGHKYKAVVTQPTCTEEGFTTYTCTVCRYKEVGDYVEATGHDYEAVVTAPTCTEEGYTTYTCACGDSYVSDYTEATGHDYEAVVTAPTCIYEGYTTYTCSVCGDSYVDDYVEATGHDYEAVVTAPTCTEEGYTTYTCACGDSYVGAYVMETGHNYEAVVTAPTCIYEGYTTYTCSVCGDSYVDDYVEATGHDYEAVVTEPTCTEAGYTTYTCACGDSYVGDHVEATGHNLVDGECTECGHREYIPGDVNGDGKVDTSDAKLIMQYDLGLIDEEDLLLVAADINGDGKVDTSDAKLIMQLDLGVNE